eukprot:146534_1
MSDDKQKSEEPIRKANPYELYLVCKSNIPILQGSNPEEPLNKNPDFYVGDIFQGKLSTEYSDYIQLRAASKTNKKQWIGAKEKFENMSIMTTFPPSIREYFHLSAKPNDKRCKWNERRSGTQRKSGD